MYDLNINKLEFLTGPAKVFPSSTQITYAPNQLDPELTCEVNLDFTTIIFASIVTLTNISCNISTKILLFFTLAIQASNPQIN